MVNWSSILRPRCFRLSAPWAPPWPFSSQRFHCAPIHVRQFAASRWVGIVFDYRSALISAVGLCNLLRSDLIWMLPLAAGLAIAGKFVLRIGDKHIFNPTNLAIVALLLLSDRVWSSSGQWGSSALYVFFVCSIGASVVLRAMRADLTLIFLGTFAAIALLRSMYFGDPLAVPLHRLQNGALLIFAFFMISDPRSTPNHPAARAIFAVSVAVLATIIEFGFYRNNGVFYALFLISPLTPLLDRLFPSAAYRWQGAALLNRLPGASALSAAGGAPSGTIQTLTIRNEI